MHTDSPEVVTITWFPVEPALTHAVSLKAIYFDMVAERTTEGLLPSQIESGQRVPWQRVVMEFYRWDRPDLPPPATRASFDGVILFNYVEGEFDKNIVQVRQDASRGVLTYLYLSHPFEERYHKDAVDDPGSGFSWDAGRIDSYGAFCLWKSTDSPLLEILRQNWSYGQEMGKVPSTLFHHYQISFDMLGTFHIVGLEVKITPLT
jgi:hypothetical protein